MVRFRFSRFRRCQRSRAIPPQSRAAQIRRASNCHREQAATAGSRTNQTGEAHFAAPCLRPSARDPPPIEPLLKTKAKVQFDRAVTERLKFLFSVFQSSNQAQFQPCFLVSAVRSAEGRKPLLVASSSELAASFVLFCSKITHQDELLLEVNVTLYHLFASTSSFILPFLQD